jgi:RNase adapter protein RapZ
MTEFTDKSLAAPLSSAPLSSAPLSSAPVSSAPSPPTPLSQREIVLVTGISGSGKSVALHSLEDAGFFCIDNLPPELLRDFLNLEHERLNRRVAIAVDIRSAKSLPHLLPLMQQLRNEGVAIQVMFLDATTDALVRRFSETRRPHPLSAEPAHDRNPNDRRILVDAIELERELLADLRQGATVRIGQQPLDPRI